ncbi:uncharacterized protein Z518_05636 [Rhinocladiella mackenziei CBS 650.93]|uniref:Uncharacterized protein n=1 Tax=Rhinocladiella mackenziei CBS 650.93 TaxID=1442369 RepID=A0A0D2INR1_9EURO|nr:uncharacterized protein Z518_05636 [Rhinocladiella mackenziei CBS 650.93]KIX04766.1 hypothetical protein Z518_05636 [Rhinocladiella mackenziei CBS 650.93]
MSSTVLPTSATKLSSTPLPRSPLTPPPSEQGFKTQDLKTQDSSTRKSRMQKQGKWKGKRQSRTGLKAIIKQVEKRKIGCGFFAVPWLRFKLSPTEFERFEQHYQKDGFVQDKLRHIKAKYPGVVIEVSHPQKRRDLPRLADDYILGSDAEIRVVVGLDLDYRGKMATVSIWRPRIQVNAAGEEELVAHKIRIDISQEFRSEDGNQIGDPQAGLRLCLEDFAPKAYADGNASLDDEIFISAHDLFTYLKDAEELDLVGRASSMYKAINPRTRKRARESTPPEELVHDDEERFTEEEKRVEEQESRGDSSYHGDSRPQPQRKQPRRRSRRS